MSVFKRLINIARTRFNTETILDEPLIEDPRSARQGRVQNENGDTVFPEQDARLADYYSNLELPYGAGLVEVNGAWKRLLKKYHPDLHSKNPDKQIIAHQLVQGLNKAHDELEKHLGG